MEYDKPEITNWNAGTEYNKIILKLKNDYIQSILIRDFDSCIELLDIDIDFSYAKIYEESLKRKKQDEIEKEVKTIHVLIKEAQDFNEHKKVDNTHSLYKKYESEIKNRLSKIRHKIWKLQGQYGVLYPQNHSKKDPRHAMKHGFS